MITLHWNKCDELLPEESGRISEKPFGSMFYRVLALVALDGDKERPNALIALRIKHMKTGTPMDDRLKEPKLLGKWIWEVDHIPQENFEVLAWTWLPAADDRNWISGKNPEDCGLDRKVVDFRIASVLTLVKPLSTPNAKLEVEMQNRFRFSDDKDWSWSRTDRVKVLAWMPIPKYEKDRSD